MKTRFCLRCGKEITKTGNGQFCSRAGRNLFFGASDAGETTRPKFPSENERAIMSEQREAQHKGVHYGENTARKYQLNQPLIKAPEGFTSMNERARKPKEEKQS